MLLRAPWSPASLLDKKHKEKNREAYLEEEKKAELKSFSELGVQRFFNQAKERQEEEELELLRQLEELEDYS